MHSSGFDDRTVTLDGTPDQLAALAAILSSRTRLEVLMALMVSPGPLHINEVARRVGIDASPARMHLELLAKAGIVEEVRDARGRERNFVTRLKNVRLTLDGVNRLAAPEKSGPPPKEVQKLLKKLAALDKDRQRIEEKARRLQAEIAAAWAKAVKRPA